MTIRSQDLSTAALPAGRPVDAIGRFCSPCAGDVVGEGFYRLVPVNGRKAIMAAPYPQIGSSTPGIHSPDHSTHCSKTTHEEPPATTTGSFGGLVKPNGY